MEMLCYLCLLTQALDLCNFGSLAGHGFPVAFKSVFIGHLFGERIFVYVNLSVFEEMHAKSTLAKFASVGNNCRGEVAFYHIHL